MLKVVVVAVVVVVSAKVQIKKQLFSRLFVSKGQKKSSYPAETFHISNSIK